MTPDQRRQALEQEFERLKERADHIDRMLQGHPDSWASLRAMIPDGTELVIDKAVAEGRQTALAMASVAKTLDALKGEEQEKAAVDPLQKIQDELKAKREQRASGA